MSRNSRDRIFGIILAAGEATRFGRLKQIEPVGGTCLLGIVVRNALRCAGIEKVVLVLGASAEIVKNALGEIAGDDKLEIVVNKDYSKGMSTSLRAGLEKARVEGCDAALFLLGDMPMIDADLLDTVIARYRSSGCKICYMKTDGPAGHPIVERERPGPAGHPIVEREDPGPAGHPIVEREDPGPAGHPIVVREDPGPAGHPIIARKDLFDEFMDVEGDIGGREVVRRNAEWSVAVDMGPDGIDYQMDINEKDDMEIFLSHYRARNLSYLSNHRGRGASNLSCCREQSLSYLSNRRGRNAS